MCQICPKLTKKAPSQMRETKFIILTSLQSFNSSFSLLFHVISTAILKFPLWFPSSPTLISHIFRISTQIPRIPTLILCTRILISFPAFPPLFSAFPSFRSPISILAWTDSLLSLYSLRSYFRKIVALVQKWTVPFFTTA